MTDRRYTRSLQDITDRLLTDRTGATLEIHLRDGRDAGLSFSQLADHITEATGGIVIPHTGTVRNWYRRLGPDPADPGPGSPSPNPDGTAKGLRATDSYQG